MIGILFMHLLLANSSIENIRFTFIYLFIIIASVNSQFKQLFDVKPLWQFCIYSEN